MRARVNYDQTQDIQRVILSLRGITDDFDAMMFSLGNEPERELLTAGVTSEVLAILADTLLNKKRILVFGDYDADGVCSTAIACTYLSNADYYIPERVDGYGLSDRYVNMIIRTYGALITVDCGIRSKATVDTIRSHGVKTIVTDHHEVDWPHIPGGVVIHPKTLGCEFTGYAGAGVIYKTMSKLFGHNDSALQLAAIGTICDVVPMIDENRKIVRNGLSLIRSDPLPGIEAVLLAAGRRPETITESDISFYAGPIINACGRMGRAELASAIVMARTVTEAEGYAKEAKALNEERKIRTRHLLESIEDDIVYRGNVIIAVFHASKEIEGLIGLVANEVSNKYKAPAIVFTKAGESYSGSCRAPVGFDCNALVHVTKRFLTSGGGHKGAAGMTVHESHMRELIDEIICYAETMPARVTDEYTADIQLDTEQIPYIIRAVNWLRPFGHKFEAPVFVSTIVLEEQAIKSIGKSGNHTRVTVNDVDFLFFGTSEEQLAPYLNSQIEVAYEMGEVWNRYTKRPSVIMRNWEVL